MPTLPLLPMANVYRPKQLGYRVNIYIYIFLNQIKLIHTYILYIYHFNFKLMGRLEKNKNQCVENNLILSLSSLMPLYEKTLLSV